MEISISYQTCTHEQLSTADQQLASAAIEAMDRSYSPYSRFRVGSAVRDIEGKITSGSNQENAAYPSGLCAERVAIFAAKSADTTDLETVVVVAQSEKGEPADAFSCGNCRQVMMEYASAQKTPIRILMRKSNKEYIVLSDVKYLLPFQFDSAKLK